MVITSSSKDQKWDPELMAGDTRIKLEQLYRFLGIKVPSDLRFKSHAETVVATCRKRALVLKCMATKNWGNSNEIQRMIYLQSVRPALEYGYPGWVPWIPNTKIDQLLRVQNDAQSSIAGLKATCRIEFFFIWKRTLSL